jgi:hypothetical protein
MTFRDDIEAGRKKFRDEQNKAKGRTRTIQRRQNPNKFLLWIGENIERIAPRARQVVSMVQPFVDYLREDLRMLGLKLHVIKEKKYDHLSAAWRRGRNGL